MTSALYIEQAPAPRRGRADSMIPPLAGRSAVGYVRVSMKGGRGGESYITKDVQREEIERKAEELGLVIVAWFEEEDVSGRTMDRPEFRHVLDAVPALADVVVVATIDRYSRNVLGGLSELEAIEAVDGLLVSYDTPIYPGMRRSHYREQVTRKLLEGEVYSEKVRERWESAVLKAIARGTYPGNVAPTGYRFVREFDEGRGEHERKDHRLVVDEQLRGPVRALFLGRAAGTAWTQLAAEFATSTGIRLHPQSLKGIVGNRAYRGELHWKGYEPNLAAHEPIVTEREWQAAQPKHVRAARPGRTGEAQSLLGGGTLRCASCGRPMSFRGGKGRQYTCQRFAGGVRCPAPVLIAADRIDEYMLAKVREKAAGRRAHGRPSDERERLLEAKVADAKAELDLYLEETSIGDVGRDSYRKGRDARAARVKAAEAEYEREIAGAGAVDEETIALADLIADLPLAGQRKIVARLVDHVSVSRLPAGAPTHSPIEARVEVVWNPALG